MGGGAVQGQSRVVPIIVALVGAVGVIVAALIANGGFSDNGDDVPPGTPNPGGPATTMSEQAPEIGGSYYLDPGNPRIILVEDRGNDSYTVSEQLPADWPFNGTVEFVGENTFTGTAEFDAGARMQITMVALPDGKLVTTFDFLTNDDGVSIERVDEHLLVPV